MSKTHFMFLSFTLSSNDFRVPFCRNIPNEKLINISNRTNEARIKLIMSKSIKNYLPKLFILKNQMYNLHLDS